MYSIAIFIDFMVMSECLRSNSSVYFMFNDIVSFLCFI